MIDPTTRKLAAWAEILQSIGCLTCLVPVVLVLCLIAYVVIKGLIHAHSH